MGPLQAAVSIALLTLFVNANQTPYTSPECPAYFNGSIAGSSCSQEYTLCINGLKQAAICTEGFVFYQDGCTPIEKSPECQLDDEETSDAEEFDCSSRPDGLVSLGCINQFVNCAGGEAYVMTCPGDLVFNAGTLDCREDCLEEDSTTSTVSDEEEAYQSQEEEEEESSGEYQAPLPSTPEPVDFDCGGLEDGHYADGCSDVFYACANGIAFRKFCPQATVFNPSQQACDYDCTDVYIPTTTTVPSTTESDVPETSTYQTTPDLDDVTSTQAPVICQEGQVSTFGMCSSRFSRCQNNAIRSKQCPVNTLFESSLLLCVFDLPQCQPVSYQPSAPSHTFYASSDTIVSPFDENVRLRPRFQQRHRYQGYGRPLIENPFFVPPSDRPHHPRRHGDRHDRRPHYYEPAIDTPFSTFHRRRAALDDEFKDFRRVNQGKINYGDARRVEGTKRFLMDDAFDGQKPKYLESTVDQVFPESRDARRILRARDDPETYDDDKTFDGKDLFGATRRKRSAGGYGSSYGSSSNQISSRQAQVNRDCQVYTTPTFLTFGDCYDQFIYCSGNGVNRMAACPIGETFNKALRACSETCGVVTSTSSSDDWTTVISSTSAPILTGNDDYSSTSAPGNDDGSSYSTPTSGYIYSTSTTSGTDSSTSYSTPTTPSNDSPSTTRSPVGDRCASVPSGLYSLGCSRKYIQCSNGAAIVRSCGANLFFDQVSQSCNFKDQVGECGSPSQDPTTTTTTDSPVTSDPYGVPSDDSDDSTTTTTQIPIGDRCAYVPSGLFAIGCSHKYLQCSNGVAIVRSCAASLYFDEKRQECAYRDQVEECGEVVTVAPGPYQPSEDQESTTAGYGTPYRPSEDQGSTQGPYRPSPPSEDQGSTTVYPYRPSEDQGSTQGSYGPSEDQQTTTMGYGTPYRPSPPSEDPQSTTATPYRPTAPQDVCTGLSDGPHGQGCSSSFIVCSYGRLVNSVTCPLGEGYDPVAQECRKFSEIQCDQTETTTDSGLTQPLPYITLDEVLASTSTEPSTTGSYVTEPSDDVTTTSDDVTEPSSSYEIPASEAPQTTSTLAYERGAEEEEENDEEEAAKCTVGTRSSTGFCVQGYLECVSDGFVQKRCRVGKLFDSHANRCVPRIACGKEAIREAIKDVIATSTVPPKKIDGRCAHIDGEAKFALGSCSSNYVQCSYGLGRLRHCPDNQVFSNANLECVGRDVESGCRAAQQPPVKSFYNNHNEHTAYCDGKADGLYGNKRDCSAILQCFGGELFEHPSCPSNLAFNELTGQCDYPQKVSGCESHGRTDGTCSEHGAFLSDASDCSVFYRCVWGRKVVMRCPSGTVFNPSLSVCDWPSAVPSCSATPDSSYNDNNSGY